MKDTIKRFHKAADEMLGFSENLTHDEKESVHGFCEDFLEHLIARVSPRNALICLAVLVSVLSTFVMREEDQIEIREAFATIEKILKGN